VPLSGDIHRETIMSVTTVLLPFAACLLSLPRIFHLPAYSILCRLGTDSVYITHKENRDGFYDGGFPRS
jgi:hypothetical protein